MHFVQHIGKDVSVINDRWLKAPDNNKAFKCSNEFHGLSRFEIYIPSVNVYLKLI